MIHLKHIPLLVVDNSLKIKPTSKFFWKESPKKTRLHRLPKDQTKRSVREKRTKVRVNRVDRKPVEVNDRV